MVLLHVGANRVLSPGWAVGRQARALAGVAWVQGKLQKRGSLQSGAARF